MFYFTSSHTYIYCSFVYFKQMHREIRMNSLPLRKYNFFIHFCFLYLLLLLLFCFPFGLLKTVEKITSARAGTIWRDFGPRRIHLICKLYISSFFCFFSFFLIFLYFILHTFMLHRIHLLWNTIDDNIL